MSTQLKGDGKMDNVAGVQVKVGWHRAEGICQPWSNSILVIKSNWRGHSYRDQVLEIILSNTLLNQMGPSGTSEGKSSVCPQVSLIPRSVSASLFFSEVDTVLWPACLLLTWREMEGTGCACKAENSRVSPYLYFLVLSVHHLALSLSHCHLSLHLSSFSIIPCIEGLIKSLSWLQAQHCNDDGVFQVGKRLLSSPWGTCN